MSEPGGPTQATRQPGTAAAEAEAIARRYFEAISNQDLDEALACWEPGVINHIAPVGELRVPDQVRQYFESVYAAMPDFNYEIVDLVTDGERVAVRWRLTGTFKGKPFQGIRPTGVRIHGEGIDMVRIENGKIQRNDSYWDDTHIGRQIGILPPKGSRTERVMTGLFNVRTALAARLRRKR